MSQAFKKSILIKYGSLIAISTGIGILSASFVLLMQLAIEQFRVNSYLVWALPLYALLSGILYTKFGKKTLSTVKIIHSVRLPHAIVSARTAVMIYVSAILSQLFGASTGREGAALQIAAGVADPLWTEKLGWRRQEWIRLALAAGFSAVFGTPLAGACFALEIQRYHKPLRMAGAVLFSSYLAKAVADLFHPHRMQFPTPETFQISLNSILLLIAFSLCLAVISWVFNFSFHFAQKKFAEVHSVASPMIGGALMLLLVSYFEFTKFTGLGDNLIASAFNQSISNFDFAGKTLTTLLCAGLGIKGGEVMPLLSIGASFGASFSAWTASFSFENYVLIWPAVGLVALFCGGAQLPITACFLTLDLFGMSTILPAFIASLIVSRLVGTKGLYSE